MPADACDVCEGTGVETVMHPGGGVSTWVCSQCGGDGDVAGLTERPC